MWRNATELVEGNVWRQLLLQTIGKQFLWNLSVALFPPQGRVDTGYALEILALSSSGEGEYECSEANYK